MNDNAVSPVLPDSRAGFRAGALARTFAAIGARTDIPFAVVLADGVTLRHGNADPAFTLRFMTPGAQRRVLMFGYVGLLESYFDGHLDVDGDLALAFRAGIDSGQDRVGNTLVALRNRQHEWHFSNRSIPQAKANARFHYGLGKAFYEPWLDAPAMMYTCAYWSEGTTTLEEAQKNKMDHVCRKVRLQPGESFVDVGCGWGGLLFHAWDHYGAIGTGINATTEQVDELRAEIARRGLDATLRVVEADFREMPGQYDKLLSIGTLEHAGPDQLDDVVRAHAEAMKPGALGVIHFIGHVGARDTEFFIRNYIFPGGWIPEPRGRAGRDGEARARGARRREPAAPLCADARLLGRALRPQLGEDPCARPGSFRRAVPPHLAQLPVVVRGGVPRQGRPAQPVPGDRQQGQRRRPISDEPLVPVPARRVSEALPALDQ